MKSTSQVHLARSRASTGVAPRRSGQVDYSATMTGRTDGPGSLGAEDAKTPIAPSGLPLADAVEDFLRSRRASGCTAQTMRTYAANLERFLKAAGGKSLGGITRQDVEGYLEELRSRMRPISAHQHYRTLRTFFRWCVRTGHLTDDPMAAITMKAPKTLPRVPADDAVQALLLACPDTFEGVRNRALVTLLADSALRKEEARRLRVGDVDLRTRQVWVHQGKCRKDGVTFFGEAAASALREWLHVHPDPRPEAFLFVRAGGDQLGAYAFNRILRRLSRRAGLVRPIGPHALRHYAATALHRQTGDLDLVRRVLRHETLAMALRYAQLTQTEVAAKFAAASPMDHLRGALPHRRAQTRTRLAKPPRSL